MTGCGIVYTSPATYTLDSNRSYTEAPTSDCITFTSTTAGSRLDCRGYSIGGPGIGLGYDGIFLNQTANVTIFNCTIHDWDNGIYANTSNNITIDSCTFYSNLNGIYFNPTNNSNIIDDRFRIRGGVYLNRSHNVSILRADINLTLADEGVVTEYADGLHVGNSNLTCEPVNGICMKIQGGTGANVSNNLFQDSTHGITANDTSGNLFTYNNASRLVTFLRLTGGSSNTISNNFFAGVAGWSQIILYAGSNGNTISNNNISCPGICDAIQVWSSSGNSITYNHMHTNINGGVALFDADSTTVSYNTIAGACGHGILGYSSGSEGSTGLVISNNYLSGCSGGYFYGGITTDSYSSGTFTSNSVCGVGTYAGRAFHFAGSHSGSGNLCSGDTCLNETISGICDGDLDCVAGAC